MLQMSVWFLHFIYYTKQYDIECNVFFLSQFSLISKHTTEESTSVTVELEY
jgi:hypothetical protein